MTDISSLPYIDLGASPADLIKYAQEHFGIRIASNAKPETVVARFAGIYKEETGKTLDPVVDNDPDEDEDDVQEPAEAPKVPKYVTINIHPDEKDPHPVTGGANFRSFRVERNKDVKVPFWVYNSLKNAVTIKTDPKTMEKRPVQTYPFSVLEQHYED